MLRIEHGQAVARLTSFPGPARQAVLSRDAPLTCFPLSASDDLLRAGFVPRPTHVGSAGGPPVPASWDLPLSAEVCVAEAAGPGRVAGGAPSGLMSSYKNSHIRSG